MLENYTITAGDLRAALARRRPRLHLYELAVLIHLHPTALSAVLNERRSLDSELAERIMRVLDARGPEAAAR